LQCVVCPDDEHFFYRYKEAVESGGVNALPDANRCVPNYHNCVDERFENAVSAIVIDHLRRVSSVSVCAVSVCGMVLRR